MLDPYSLGLRRSSFTDSEAQSKIGRLVRLTADFGRVPAETVGQVVGLLRSQVLGILVDVEWFMPGDRRDAFTQEDYEVFLDGECEPTPAMTPPPPLSAEPRKRSHG